MIPWFRVLTSSLSAVMFYLPLHLDSFHALFFSLSDFSFPVSHLHSLYCFAVLSFLFLSVSEFGFCSCVCSFPLILFHVINFHPPFFLLHSISLVHSVLYHRCVAVASGVPLTETLLNPSILLYLLTWL